MKDTIRIILFLDCIPNCAICVNGHEQFYDQFEKKKFDEIDFSLYKNVCISGGEPFLEKDSLYSLIEKIPPDKNIFIYTSGLLINWDDIQKLKLYPNIKSINIELYGIDQLASVRDIEKHLPVRFSLLGSDGDRFSKLGKRLNDVNLKLLALRNEERPNEDWVLLNE